MFLWKLTSLLSDAVQRYVSFEIWVLSSCVVAIVVLSCVSQGCLIAVSALLSQVAQGYKERDKNICCCSRSFWSQSLFFFWCGRKAVARRICETFGPWRLAFFRAARSWIPMAVHGRLSHQGGRSSSWRRKETGLSLCRRMPCHCLSV
jgi:hypothetical protein